MLNKIWAVLLFIGIIVAGITGHISGTGSVVDEAAKAAEKAVMGIALPLAGMMMFWLGVLRLMEKGGVLSAVVRTFRPVLRRLFPDVPPEHPAMGAMVMNLSANMLGLSNNATPMGLKAMGHLQELNVQKQSPSNTMVTFLALNTAGFTLIPITAMNFLNAAGISNSYRVIIPTILATACTSTTAVIAARFFQRMPRFAQTTDAPEAPDAVGVPSASASGISRRAKGWLGLLTVLFIGISALELGPRHWRPDFLAKTGLQSVIQNSEKHQAEAARIMAEKKAAAATAQQTSASVPSGVSLWRRTMDGASGLAIPAILLAAVGLAWARGVPVYEEFVEGAKEGFQVAVRIMPYLVAMLSVLGILRASGAFLLLEHLLAPLLTLLGFPVELLSLALMRPLSGSGAQGLLTEILTRADLSESVKLTAAILYGSTETTFYVLTVYFGSVGIRRFRHALLAGLTADFVGMVAAIGFGRLLFA
ncbi:MAG: nucleoside recognition protein [Verrucomicrobiaceae bacterium]|nr:nucleoside recognition protein [Verrucomicrobiaceae bacterium]